MNVPNVELHVEELVLHGFAPGDRDRIAEAVRGELERLFAEQGVPPSLTRGGEMTREMTRLNGGSFAIEVGGNPEAVGGQVAHAVYKGLNR